MKFLMGQTIPNALSRSKIRISTIRLSGLALQAPSTTYVTLAPRRVTRIAE